MPCSHKRSFCCRHSSTSATPDWREPRGGALAVYHSAEQPLSRATRFLVTKHRLLRAARLPGRWAGDAYGLARPHVGKVQPRGRGQRRYRHGARHGRTGGATMVLARGPTSAARTGRTPAAAQMEGVPTSARVRCPCRNRGAAQRPATRRLHAHAHGGRDRHSSCGAGPHATSWRIAPAPLAATSRARWRDRRHPMAAGSAHARPATRDRPQRGRAGANWWRAHHQIAPWARRSAGSQHQSQQDDRWASHLRGDTVGDIRED